MAWIMESIGDKMVPKVMLNEENSNQTHKYLFKGERGDAEIMPEMRD